MVDGCLALAHGGESRCPRHQAPVTLERDRGRRARREARTKGRAASRMRGAVNKQGWAPCSVCGEVWPADQIEIDHDVPLADGGADVGGNVRPMCVPCHRVKTTTENQARARQRRGRSAQG